MIPVSLPIDTWNLIAAALAELPFRVAAPVINELQKQVAAAQAPAPPEPPAEGA